MKLHKSLVTGKYIDSIEAYHEELDFKDKEKRMDKLRPPAVVIDDPQPLPYEDSNFDTGISGDFKQHKTFKKEEL